MIQDSTSLMSGMNEFDECLTTLPVWRDAQVLGEQSRQQFTVFPLGATDTADAAQSAEGARRVRSSKHHHLVGVDANGHILEHAKRAPLDQITDSFIYFFLKKTIQSNNNIRTIK